MRMERHQQVALNHQLHVGQQDLGAKAQQGHGPRDQHEEPGGAESQLDGIAGVEVKDGCHGGSDVVQREIGQADRRRALSSRERIERGGQHQGTQGETEAHRDVEGDHGGKPAAIGTQEPPEEPAD